jgi:CDP-glucose 4,6-dehydratase
LHGYALRPDDNALFDRLGLSELMAHTIGDIRDRAPLAEAIRAADPEVVLHLAAQPLVLASYEDPVETWHTNVLGTVNVLDAIRTHSRPRAVVVVTTDKVYANREWPYAYRETDRLGGHDPYSATKAATETVADSFRASFYRSLGIRLATARAGNVIGGGDWAANRLVPDIVRALMADKPITIRNPASVRPWQHVLDPVSGYLRLTEALWDSDEQDYLTACNFGPGVADHKSVEELVETIIGHWPGRWVDASNPGAPKETRILKLSIENARDRLGWEPRWPFETAIAKTVDWYRCHHRGGDIRVETEAQIAAFEEDRQ